MDEIEITEILPLSPNEQSLLDMHSVVNVLNVLRCELTLLGLNAADDEYVFADGLALCDRMFRALENPESALREASQIDESERIVFDEIDAKLASSLQPRSAEIEESLANLHSVFAILKVRSREILARSVAPDQWEQLKLEDLRTDCVAFLDAIAKNSRGRFRIRYNAALQEPADYYVDLRFENVSGQLAVLPPGFRDVIRDLIANARKYTEPGGRITAALYEDTEMLRFVVADTGRGIPKAELATVMQFGKRASNVGDVRTMGGGFGLTKAFLVTKHFGGSFWIASELNIGTKIRILIPRPQ